jgi:hypothetical protein
LRSQGFSRLASHTVAMRNHHSNSIGKPLELRRARGRFRSALAVVLALSGFSGERFPNALESAEVRERLLQATFPTIFEHFVSRTRYRLIPLVWWRRELRMRGELNGISKA